MVKFHIGKKGFMCKLQPKDLIATIVLLFCFYLISIGYNGYIHGLTAMIIGYYFSKRTYEEVHRRH